MQKLPRLLNLVTGQQGRVDLSTKRSSTFPDTFEVEVTPPMSHLIDIQPVFRKYWIRNIPEHGGMVRVEPPNSSLKGVDESGLVLIVAQVDKDGNLEYSGGILSQLNKYIEDNSTFLRKQLKDLEIEKEELRRQKHVASTDNLTHVKELSHVKKLITPSEDERRKERHYPVFGENE